MEYYKKIINFKIGISKFRMHMLMLFYTKSYKFEYILFVITDLILQKRSKDCQCYKENTVRPVVLLSTVHMHIYFSNYRCLSIAARKSAFS